MQLRDRGRLSLDDPIVKYAESTRRHDPRRHRRDHTIPVAHEPFRASGWHLLERRQGVFIEHQGQLVAMSTEAGPFICSRYGYSNRIIGSRGRIERLTGDDYEVYVTKNILMPLGMTRNYFDVTPYHLLKDRSYG